MIEKAKGTQLYFVEKTKNYASIYYQKEGKNMWQRETVEEKNECWKKKREGKKGDYGE